MIIKLLIEGGDMKPGPAIAQQLGPMGINMGKVISEVNEATKEFKGMKVPVELDIDEKTKEFNVKALSPPTSELLKKELKLEKGSSDQKLKVANASIEDIIKIAKIKHPYMLDKEFKSAVKSVLGTCASIGIMVENLNANEVIQKIDKFNKEIEEQATETSSEKRLELDRFFSEVKKSQEAKKKLEEASKESEEEKKEQKNEAKENKSEEKNN